MGFSLSELLIIVIVAIVVVGPKKLPDVAKSVGKGYAEFRKALTDLKKSVDIADVANIPTKNQNAYKSKWQEQISDIVPKEDSQTDNDNVEVTNQPRAKRSDIISGE